MAPLHHHGHEPPALQGRSPEHGPLPPAGPRRTDARFPYATPPRRRPGQDRLCPGRADARGGGFRRRPGPSLRGLRTTAALPLRGFVRGLPARGGRGDGASASPTIWRCRPTPSWSSRAGWTPESCAGKAPSATTRATTPWRTTTRCCTWKPSPCASIPSSQPPSSGRPPQEDAYLGLATERIFLPLVRLFLPEVVDMHLPPGGAFHNLVVVAIKKEFPGQAQKVMNALWGHGPDDVHQGHRRGGRGHRSPAT